MNAFEKSFPKAYPLPVTDILNISLLTLENIISYKIFTVQGQLVKCGYSKAFNKAHEIDLSFLSSGIYYFLIKGQDDFVYKIKVVKK